MWIWTYLRTAGDNFHTVVDGVLYRSATPSPENLEKWHRKYKLAVWLDLRRAEDFDGDRRTPSDKTRFFERQMGVCRHLGIERVWLPISDRTPTSDESIRSIMHVLNGATKERPVLVACQGGRHRTGLAVALYRMRVQGWPAETPDKKGAFDEAKKRGFYDHDHEAFGAHFRKLIGLLLILLMAVPAFGQGTVKDCLQVHPFIQPQVSAPVLQTSVAPSTYPSDVSTKPAKFDTSFWVASGLWAAASTADIRTTLAALEQPQVSAPVLQTSVAPSTYPSDVSTKPAKFDTSFWVASGLWAAASTADIRTTLAALERGGVERNPIFAANGRRSLRLGANIVASVGTWSYAAWLERRGHRKLARLVLIVGAVLRTTAAVWNNTRARR